MKALAVLNQIIAIITNINIVVDTISHEKRFNIDTSGA